MRPFTPVKLPTGVPWSGALPPVPALPPAPLPDEDALAAPLADEATLPVLPTDEAAFAA